MQPDTTYIDFINKKVNFRKLENLLDQDAENDNK